jgi:hypothetical protein
MKATLERAGLVALCVAIGWFYVWTVRSSGDPWKFGLEQRDYYNLLIDGWLDGQLHMKVEVPEALLQLKDPYDPALRPVGLGLHDASFFQGKYYVYFGAAPIVVLMLPFRLWSGLDLPLAVAALSFVYGGFLASVVIFLGVRRRYFPGAGWTVVFAGVLGLGLAGLGPVLLRRPHMWELPIGAGYCFAMGALWCVWRSLQVSHAGGDDRRSRGRARWFAGAGLCLGLAIASRPTYLMGSPFLAVPLLWWWWSERRLPWRAAVGALIPLALIGGTMAWHNYARFGDPLQFGQAYQFSLDYESKMAHFRATHVPFNVWRYFFSAAEWSRYFPFIQPAALPSKPPGFGGHDDVYGLLANLPIMWFALAAPLAWWRRDQTERRALRAWLATVAVLFCGMAGTLVFFFGSLARYQSDFAPSLVLLAVVGGLAVDRCLGKVRGPGWRVAGRIAWGAAAAFSAVFAILFSLQLDGLLLERNPAEYREVARLLNRVPATIERVRGIRHGPLVFPLRLTAAPAGTRERLFSVGRAPVIDEVFLRHTEGGRVRFEIASAHGVVHPTREVAGDPSVSHALRVSMGSLLPPDGHPLAGPGSEAEYAALARRLRVEFDGEVIADRIPWFAGPPGAVTIASSLVTAAGVRRDEAAIAGLLRESADAAREAAARLNRRGELRLRLTLPRDREGQREPLLVTGRPGRGDLLAVEYVDGSTVRFVFDHWGGELRRSEPVRVDFRVPHEVRVVMESLRIPWGFRPNRVVTNGPLEVWLDSRNVWSLPVEFHAVNPVEIAIGRNAIGGTSCGPEFTGSLEAIPPAAR